MRIVRRSPQPAVGGPAVGAPRALRNATRGACTNGKVARARNDTQTMGPTLHDDFSLVLGRGKNATRADLLNEARAGKIQYEKQDEDLGTQTVRMYGDTAIVTARLWLKYTYEGKPAERRLWFSDTYVRTPKGWRYVFGQASLPLPTGESG